MSETTKKSPIEGCNLQKGEVTGASHSIRSKQIINEQPGIASFEAARFQAFYGIAGNGVLTAAPTASLAELADPTSAIYKALLWKAQTFDIDKPGDFKAHAIAFNAVYPIVDGANNHKQAAGTAKEHIEALTGFVAFDIDTKDNNGLQSERFLEDLKAGKFANDLPFIAFAEMTKSGGLHIVAYTPHDKAGNKLEGLPGGDDSSKAHRAAGRAIMARLSGTLGSYGILFFDTQDVTNRLKMYYLEPGLVYVNPNPQPFTFWTMPETLSFPATGHKAPLFYEYNPKTRPQNGAKYEGWQQLPDYEKAMLALARIAPDVKRTEWTNYLRAAKGAGLEAQEFEAWSATAGNYKAGEVPKIWSGLKAFDDPRLLIQDAGGQDVLTKDAIAAGLLSDNKPKQSSARQPRFSGLREELNQQQEEDDGEPVELEAPTIPADLWQDIKAFLPAVAKDCEALSDEPNKQIALFQSFLAAVCPILSSVYFVDGEGYTKPLTLFHHVVAQQGSGKAVLNRIFDGIDSRSMSMSLQTQAAGFWLDNDLNGGSAVFSEHEEAAEQGAITQLKEGRKDTRKQDQQQKEEPKPVFSYPAAMIMNRKAGLKLNAIGNTTDARLLKDMQLLNGAALLFFSEANKLSNSHRNQHSASFIETIKQAVSGDRVAKSTAGEGVKAIKAGKLSLIVTSTPDQLKDLYGKRLEEGFFGRAMFSLWSGEEVKTSRNRKTGQTNQAYFKSLYDAAAMLNATLPAGGLVVAERNGQEPEGIKQACESILILKPFTTRILESYYKKEALLAVLSHLERVISGSGMSLLETKLEEKKRKIKDGLENGVYSLPDKEEGLSSSEKAAAIAYKLTLLELENKAAVLRYIADTAGRSSLQTAISQDRKQREESQRERDLKRLSSLLLEHPKATQRELAGLMSKGGQHMSLGKLNGLKKVLEERG